MEGPSAPVIEASANIPIYKATLDGSCPIPATHGLEKGLIVSCQRAEAKSPGSQNPKPALMSPSGQSSCQGSPHEESGVTMLKPDFAWARNCLEFMIQLNSPHPNAHLTSKGDPAVAAWITEEVLPTRKRPFTETHGPKQVEPCT